MRLWDDAKALRRVTLWLYTLVVIAVCVAGFRWLWHSPYFPIENIHFHGQLQETDASKLAEVAQRNITGNFFKADMNLLKEALVQDPWIESVNVQRLWPNTINVFVVEHKVKAKRDNGQLVNEKGVIFGAKTDKVLPELVGEPYMLPKMVVFQDKMIPLLKQKQLGLKRLEVSERGAWTVVLDNAVVVKLGRRDLEPRLERFVSYWQRDLAPLGQSLEYVDTRYHDGFAIKRNMALAVKKDKAAVEAKPDGAMQINPQKQAVAVANTATIQNNESN